MAIQQEGDGRSIHAGFWVLQFSMLRSKKNLFSRCLDSGKYHTIMNCCFERSFTCVYKDIKLVSASGKTCPFEVMRPAGLTAAWIKVTPSGGPARTSEYLRYVTTVTGKPIGFDMTRWLWCCETDMDEIKSQVTQPNPWSVSLVFTAISSVQHRYSSIQYSGMICLHCTWTYSPKMM